MDLMSSQQPTGISQQMYSYDADKNCMCITHETRTYLFDPADFCKILNHHKSFLFHETDRDYPSFIYNDKCVNYLEFLYKDGDIANFYFHNGNKYDLRTSNVVVSHPMNRYVRENYHVVESILGHYPRYKHANIMKNPLWKIIENNGPNVPKEKILMYCEPNTFCILCEESYQKVLDFEREKNNGHKLTFHKPPNGYIQTHLTNGTVLYIHQIITGFYGQGRGTKHTSVDHIDRNPLNNSMENLRLATREDQEQNSRGIAPNTKRERQTGARALPEGIHHSMLRKYVVYYLNTYNKEKNKTRQYFRVEHPALDVPWESSKSGKVDIMEKLEKANKVAEDLENGIYPEKQTRELPRYVSLIHNKNGKMSLVFDKKGNDGLRYNMKMTMETEDLEHEIEKLREKIMEKYPEMNNIFI